jgi:triosephosphate isomerase
MNKLASEVKAYADDLAALCIGSQKWCDTVICAPFTALTSAVQFFCEKNIYVGAQNMSQFTSGAYTGEVSGEQLKDIGVEFVIIGHSERRELYGETDESVNKKTIAALDFALCPIVCVGESLEQREQGVTIDIVEKQVKTALNGISADTVSKVVIAYEPIWAIGTGKTASPQDAQEVCHEIRNILESLYNPEIAKSISILYGGSMNEKNAHELLAQEDIDGGLVGGASLKPESFAAIIHAANQ